jgi:chromosome segregation ATPase
MKIKVVIIILAVACAGLGIAIFATKKQADDQHTTDVKSIEDFSNQVVAADKQINELGQVNLTLSNDLAVAQAQLALTAEQVVQLSNSLMAATSTLADTKTSLAGAQEMVTNLNARIADLEAQNKDLDAQASALSNQLAQLTVEIENTRTLLAISTTNNIYLQGELQKQLSQKAELEHKFNDLDELRAQVRKMKDEMFIARRVQLMKYDNAGKKGAALLSSHATPAGVQPHTVSTYDLNVEVGSDGTVRVIPPLGGTNNAAP